MKLELEQTGGGNRIEGYDAAGIRINGRLYTETLLLTPSVLRTDILLRSIEALDAGLIATIASLSPALLIIGTGANHRFPSASVLVLLQQAGIGVEVMTTAAACRSYAVLVGESREVAALLLPPGSP